MRKKSICTVCGYIGQPDTVTKGSLFLEVFLWGLAICSFFLLVPVLIAIFYSHWRSTTRQRICPKCGNSAMIPEDTPVGRELMKRLESDIERENEEDYKIYIHNLLIKIENQFTTPNKM